MKLNIYYYMLIVFIPIFPVSIMQLSIRSEISKFERMAPFIETNGSVSKLDCANHGEYYVKYNINNIESIQKAAYFLLKGECKRLHVDESVKVWVSERDAKYVSFREPDSALNYMRSEANASLFAYPIFVAFIAFFTKFKNHKLFGKSKNT